MKRLLRLLFNVSLACAWLAPAAVAVSALGRVSHRYAELLMQFTAPALACTALALAGLVLLRRWAWATAYAAVALALLVALAPAWRSHPPATGEPLARVYLANLWARNEDVGRMAGSIAAANPDIVVLIELGDAPAAELDRLLEGYPHRVATLRVDRPSGAARSVIASRWPLRELDAGLRDGLSVVSAEARLPDGSRLRVLGAHLTRPWPFQWEHAQERQTERLLARLGPAPERTLLVGDFNAAPGAPPIRMLEREGQLRLAPVRVGTWPAAAPGPLRIGIDHALVSQDLVVTDRRLGRATGSDHRPVIVEVAAAGG